MSALCPHCGKIVTSMNVIPMDAKDGPNKTWKSAVFTCPFCRKILGASFDQISHTNSILEEIKKLGRR